MAKIIGATLLMAGLASLMVAMAHERARVLQEGDEALPFGTFCYQPEGQPWCALSYDIFLTKEAPALPAKSKDFIASALLKGQALIQQCGQAQNASSCKGPCKWTVLSGSYAACMVDQEKWISKTYCPKSQALSFQLCRQHTSPASCSKDQACFLDTRLGQCSYRGLQGVSEDDQSKFFKDFRLLDTKVWGCCDAYSYQKTMQTWDYGYFPTMCQINKAGQCEPSQYCASHPEVPDSCIVSPAGHFRLLFGENTTLANWAVEMGEKYCTYSQEAAWCNPPDDAPSLTLDGSKVSQYTGMKLPKNRPFPTKTCDAYLPFKVPGNDPQLKLLMSGGARRLGERSASSTGRH